MIHVITSIKQIPRLVDDLKDQLATNGSVAVEINADDKRTASQNRFQHECYKIFAEHGGMPAEDYRTYFKLKVGIEILRSTKCTKEGERFINHWVSRNKNTTYEQQFEDMIGYDLPVTRIMTKKQKQMFLNELVNFGVRNGFPTPMPSEYGLNNNWEPVKDEI